MNIKEACIKAIKGVIQQGDISTNEKGKCMYRGDNNMCCAVGHLITDEAYFEELEEQAVEDLDVINALAESLDWEVGKVNENLPFFTALQNRHDSMTSNSRYRFGDKGPALIAELYLEGLRREINIIKGSAPETEVLLEWFEEAKREALS